MLFASALFAQPAGYKFENYEADVITDFKKAAIDYHSNKIGLLYKEQISEAYQAENVQFAGYYIVALWDCGIDCMNGVMIDVRDGKIYDLPLGETRYHASCTFDENDNCCVLFGDGSRLFITEVCVQSVKDKTNDVQHRESFVNVWNEKTKQFEFYESVRTQKIVPSEE